MWSALVNGAGLHGGGGGYVQSQGWEFVPRSRIEKGDRGRGKNRSPLRRISSPPAVFSHIQEPPLGAAQTGGEAGAGTQVELPREQMWPGAEAQHMQHTRLKKKLEELKKRHAEDKEEWTREKEALLREVAEIQGGENRRILLDLKTVLEEVQVEVKREEEKRSELQLQYTRDRCAWELEKAELKCRIAQLENREATGLVTGGLKASRAPRELNSETPTLSREREEHRRILSDTRAAAMDLRCHLKNTEKDWKKEKAELLERFEVERKEWGNQLKDMQRKVEELYSEVRARRVGTELDSFKQDDAARRLSMHSASAGSSLISDTSHSELLSSSTQSEATSHATSCGPAQKGNIRDAGDTPFLVDYFCGLNTGGQSSHSAFSKPELLLEMGSLKNCNRDPNDTKTLDTSELEAFYHDAQNCEGRQHVSKGTEKYDLSSQESTLWRTLTENTKKTKNTTALNAALKEIARVSEELCSYQDEIRRKTGDKRNENLCELKKNWLQAEEPPCDLSQIYEDLRALENENWITLSQDNTWKANRRLSDFWTPNTVNVDFYRSTEKNTEVHSDMDTVAPPIPPRTSSWNLSSSNADSELYIPDSPMATVRKCHSPCVLLDRKCNSPSIVRKFEAMLQENEGKVFKDGALSSCSVPANSNCNKGCCHNRWSCDATKFTHNNFSPDGSFQKSFSEVNIVTAKKNFLQLENIQMAIKDQPVDLITSSVEPESPALQGSRRNLMLERKTAEFNRALFQAEMGLGLDVQDSLAVKETCYGVCQPILSSSADVFSSKDSCQPLHSDDSSPILNMNSNLPSLTSISSFIMQNPESQLTQIQCATEDEEFTIAPETPPIRSSEEPQDVQATKTTPSSELQGEGNHKVGTTVSPSRKSLQNASTDSVSTANTQSGPPVEKCNSKRESSHGVMLQPATAHQQPSVENKKRQVAQPRHLSGSPSLRMLNEHPWKPLTLAAYPRPEGSRSNYGAVERILKNYENAARAQQNESQQDEMNSGCHSRESDILDMDQRGPIVRQMQTSPISSISCTTEVMKKQLNIQEDESPSVIPSLVLRNFSRPARPANRRPPSRWASQSPTLSSSPSLSRSTTPAVSTSFHIHKNSSSFSHSHSFHIETVII